MKVSIDGEHIDVERVGDAETLREAVDCLREKGALGESDVVLEAALDGASCADTPAEDIGQVRLDGVGELSLETGSAREYGIRVLHDAGEVTSFLRDAAGRVAASLRNDPPREGNSQLYRLLDSVHTLLLLLRCIDDAWGLEGMSFAGEDDAVVDRLSDTLNDIQEAQQNEDWAGLADHLDAGLVDMLEEIAGVISETRREAEKGRCRRAG